ncbi:hypothetical protein BX616_003745 [Lobosporangium transversale]|nr:hypothetical protein BX616_003745 [Lobosporangium transversale]
MFGKTYTSTRGVLSPSKALRLFNLYMEDARRIDNDHEILMELCLDADFALSRIQQSRKNLASSASNGDKMLCQAVASAYYEVARLFGRLGRLNDAKKSDGKAEKWGYIQGSSIVRQESLRTHIPTNSNSNSNNNSNSNSNSSEQRSGGISIGKLKGAIKGAGTLKSHSPAVVPKDIFSHDVVQVKLEYNLPPPGAYLDDTQQLVNCLSLLPTAPIPKTNPSEQEQGWALAVLDDQDEQERLRNLASGVISTFIQDNIKAKAIVAEVVMLAPVLNQDQYRAVLMALVKGIGQNIMLEIHLLEGLAQLIQYASPGYLDSDDMVVILSNLSSRLQGTHGQSSGHIYQLCVTVSHVLDAMINNQVKGLKREQLHEPLAACLKGLKESSDPHLVYHAAYAFQALLYIPNDESTMQSMLRRASAVARGVFGLVSAVKELNLNAFMDELVNIQNGLPYVADIVDTSLDVYNGAVSLYESGTTFRECMEEGLSFSRKSAWYPALRGADSFLRTGELTKFKALVCEAPCRRDLAFQWGLCQRLGQIAVDTQWTMETRQGAIAFLGVIYKNDEDWGNRVEIKQWIITILKKLISLAKEDLQGKQI